MGIHPKVFERAVAILAKSEEDINKELENITNRTVLTALLQQERAKDNRESVLNIIKDKLGIQSTEGVSNSETESLSQQYLGEITESDKEVIVFKTTEAASDKKDKKEKEEGSIEEETIDSSPDNS
jgi:hypothetical protein